MKNIFLAISSAGPNRDFSKGTREQLFWDEHAKFIDQLVDDGFILMGGPLVDEGGSLLVFNAGDENEVREKLKNDPWAKHGILKLESVKRWEIFIDQRKKDLICARMADLRTVRLSDCLFLLFAIHFGHDR